MKCLVFSVFVFGLVSIEKSYALDCVLDGDGIYEKGCVSFIKCINGTAYNIECHDGQVFNSLIQDCDDSKNAPKPCGEIIDCTLKQDGHYPDLDMGCHSYYTCNSGTFLGHNYCPAVSIEKSDALDCALDGDGIYEKGCVSFIKCINGTAYNIECHDGQVFNSLIQDCDDPKKAPKPCGEIIDCTLKQDGHYPDLDMGCHSFYTCNGGFFFGHNYCPPGLVFSPESGVCDWQHNVYFPCGIMPHPPTTEK